MKMIKMDGGARMDGGLLKKLTEADFSDQKTKESFFEKRTKAHIALVGDAIEKIVAQYPEFKELLPRKDTHDKSKFEEPERTPYIELTWRKFVKNNEADPNINKATLHHIMNNSHHPEYWNKAEANLSKEDRDKSDKVIDASKMPDLEVAEMVADWQAMSEELQTNTARQWYDSVKDKRWRFSKHQDELIDKLIKVFE